MPFKSTIRIPSEVLDAIVSLTELTTSFAIESAMEAGRADATGRFRAEATAVRRGAEYLDGSLATVRP